MKEHSNDRDKAEQSAHQRKNRGKGRAKRVWGVIGTIVLVGVLTMAIFVGIFMTYINKSLKGHVEVDMSEYDRKVSTELYRLGTDGETWEMYQTLFSDENRIWVDIGDIPKYLQEATIAIEDKRFETHHGVDWKGTLRAITRTLTGSGTQGGSTITQQLLKNVTGDNQVTVKRKITEIYRALALEKDYSKSQILEMYLNTIYLGEQCYGVQTAARMYFHKDVKDLTLAECACLIGITNNPSMYDPLLSDWTRENNRERQLTILGEMLGQEKIDQATYDAAAAEEVQFSDGYTNLGNFTEPTEDQETPEKPTVQSTANNSYYTDQVISDVAAALVEKLGLEDKWVLSKLNTLIREVTDNMEAYELGVASAKIYDFIWDTYCDWYIELTKTRLYGEDEEAKLAAQNVLCYVLLRVLELLHPFMPFITEEIWQALPHEGDYLIRAQWPTYRQEFDFAAEERAMEAVKDAISAVRARRAEMNVPPSRKAKIIITSQTPEIYVGGRDFITRLAYASEVEVGTQTPQDLNGMVTVSTHDATMYLPLAELVDIEKELERIGREITKARENLERIEKKLQNESFVSKAPEAVVNAEREKADKARALIVKLEESAQAMRG